MGWLKHTAAGGALLLVVACASKPNVRPTLAPDGDGDEAPKDAGPGDAEQQRAMATVEDAEAEMRRVEAELDGALGGAKAVELDAGRCERLCRSVDAMQRAVDALCELTGSDDERCENAQSRLENSRRRVSDAGCAC